VHDVGDVEEPARQQVAKKRGNQSTRPERPIIATPQKTAK
jgi:hypothetical protein